MTEANVTRRDLLDWLESHILADRVSIMFPKGDADGPGWTRSKCDSTRALAAWRAGTLEREVFHSETEAGKPYEIKRGNRLGVVLHRDGMVRRFCIDLDAHEGGVDNTHLADRIDDFLGAEGVRFTSKSGRGLHLFYALVDSVPVTEFVEWSRAWEFNRTGQPECFPKTAKLSQVWLPNEPNAHGGDAYKSGHFETCIVRVLPTPPPLTAPKATRPPHDADDRPGDAFAKSNHPWADILNGDAVCVREFDGKSYWRRTGKTDAGISATTGVCRSDDGREYLYVFSSNWPPFEPNKAYDKFGAYALLRHGGDFSAAARDLAAQGWGRTTKAQGNCTAITKMPAKAIASVPSTAIEPDDEEIFPDEPNPLDPGPFPSDLLAPPGLLGAIVEHNLATAMYPQPVLALAGALSLMATITGRRIADARNTRSNIYIVAIAPTSAGKDHSRRLNKEILTAAGAETMIGSERIGSHAGIINAVAESPALLFQIDEIAHLMATMKNSGRSPWLYNISSVLLQLYGSSDGLWIADALADTSRVKRINQPHAVVHGSATPEKFWANLSTDNVSEGLLGRCLIFEAEYVPFQEPKPAAVPDAIVDRVRWWASLIPGTGNLALENPTPERIAYEPDADERLIGHIKAISDRRMGEDPITAALWSRSGEKAAKLALLFACSRADVLDNREFRISLADVNLAIKLANWLTRRMIFQCRERVGENAVELVKLRVLQIVGDQELSYTSLNRKTQFLTARDRGEIVGDLVSAGRLREKRIDTPGRPKKVVYRPVAKREA